MRHRGGVVVGLHAAHECLVIVEVEALDLILTALVLIDRLLVQHRVGAAPVHLRDGAIPVEVDDDEVVPARAPE